MLNPSHPKADLHRHLEGSVRLGTVLEIAQLHGIPMPAADIHGLQSVVWMDEPVTDILKILPRFDVLRNIFIDYEICKRVTRECLEDAASEELDFIELRFSPLFMAEPYGLQPISVCAAVCEAWQETSRKLSLASSLTVILSRTYGPDACQIELEAALVHRVRGIAAIDLAGDEARWPAGLFRQHFQQARQAGLHRTAHAGEFAGYQSVQETIFELEPERLGHAVHAADDPATLDLIAERSIAVECCPTSNLLTGAVASLSAHPLPVFLSHGICATLNTDDPTLFKDLKLADEYQLAHDQIGLNFDQLNLVQRNTWEARFLAQQA